MTHEIGHALNLGHGGDQSNNSPNRNPTYPSLMNYAYGHSLNADYDNVFSNIQFSPGDLESHNVDRQNLNETQPFAPGKDIGFLGKYPYFYPVDSSNRVDWNRDGVLEASVKAMMSPTPFMFHGAADIGYQQEVLAIPSTTTNTGVEIASFVRSGSPAMYVFAVNPTTGALSYSYTTQSVGGWTPWSTIAASGTVRAGVLPATARGTIGGNDTLFVLAASSNGTKIVVYRVSTAGNITGPAYVNTPASTNGINDVSAVKYGGSIYAFYRTPVSQFWAA